MKDRLATALSATEIVVSDLFEQGITDRKIIASARLQQAEKQMAFALGRDQARRWLSSCVG